MGVLDHHGEIERRHVGHAALGMTGVEIGAEEDVVLVGRFRRDKGAHNVGVRPDRPALALGRTEIVDQHAHRHAGPAALTRGPVGDCLRAAEAGLGQEVVEGGGPFADQMGENLPLLLAGQVGARRRSGQIKLRGVARFPAHTVSNSPPKFVAGVKQCSRIALKPTNSQPPDDHDAGDDVMQAALFAIDQRHEQDRREEPAHIKQHGLDSRIDERDPRAGVLHAHFEIHRPHAGRRHSGGPRR